MYLFSSFFYSLFYTAVGMSDYIASNLRVTDECSIGKDFKVHGNHLIGVLSWHLPGGTEENEKLQSCSRYPA
jgi:hypothetical protein